MKTTRLNVYISQSGLCSRRKADELIQAGEITVNHWPMTNPAYEVQEKDTVRHKKMVVKPESLTYLVMNKPEGYITSLSDEHGRPTVIDLLDKNVKNRVYPVGRLDYNTTGVLLLTNDGELAQKLAHPSSMIKKVYRVTVKEDVSADTCTKLKRGVYLEDGPGRVDSLFVGQDRKTVRVTIHSGRNRIIRRMFEALGYTIRKLERISFASLTSRNVAVGAWRVLRPAEVKKLQAIEAPKKSKKTEEIKKRVLAIKKSAARAKNSPAARKRRFSKKTVNPKSRKRTPRSAKKRPTSKR